SGHLPGAPRPLDVRVQLLEPGCLRPDRRRDDEEQEDERVPAESFHGPFGLDRSWARPARAGRGTPRQSSRSPPRAHATTTFPVGNDESSVPPRAHATGACRPALRASRPHPAKRHNALVALGLRIQYVEPRATTAPRGVNAIRKRYP